MVSLYCLFYMLLDQVKHCMYTVPIVITLKIPKVFRPIVFSNLNYCTCCTIVESLAQIFSDINFLIIRTSRDMDKKNAYFRTNAMTPVSSTETE